MNSLLNDLNAFFHEKFAPRKRTPRTIRQRHKAIVHWTYATFMIWFLASIFGITGLSVEVSLWYLLLIPVSVAGMWFFLSFAVWYEKRYL